MQLFCSFWKILFICIFIFGCTSCSSSSDFCYQSPRYIKLAHEITEKTGKQLKEQKGLFLVGTGGQMMDDIQMMMMGFNFYEVIDIETTRKLLVDSV